MVRKIGLVFSIIFLSVFIGSFLRIAELNLNEAPVKNVATVLSGQTADTPSARVVIWFSEWERNFNPSTSNLPTLGASKFVTHVMIDNLDYNQQRGIDTNIRAKIAAIRSAGLIPIWSRWLFFQDSDDSTLPEAQEFVPDYTDGSIVKNANYYAWFLKKLKAEANSLNIDLVAIDTEPHINCPDNPLNPSYDDPECINRHNFDIKGKIMLTDLPPAEFNLMASAVQSALAQSGVEPTDYLYPSDSFGKQYSGYRAISELGNFKINNSTYRDCQQRLNPTYPNNGDILGIWVTTNMACYRPANGTCTTTSNSNCFIEPGSPINAGWLPASIFNNVNYWYNHNPQLGLFLYPAGVDNSLFPPLLNTYCQNNLETCNQYNYNSQTISDIAPPSQPTGLNASNITTTTATLSWRASTDNVAVDKYRVWRDGAPIGEIPLLTFDDNSFPNNSTVQYYVTALDTAGNQSSPSIPLVINDGVPVVDNIPPIISNVRVAAKTNTTAFIIWDTNELSDTKINYGLTANYGDTSFYSNLVKTHYRFITALQPGQTYHYQVVSTDQHNNSASSQDFNFQTNSSPGAEDTTLPNTPANLIATPLSPTQIKIAWSPATDPVVTGQISSGVVSYNLYLNEGTAPFTSVTTTEYEQTPLTPNTPYTYRVSAVDGASLESVVSSAVSATTLADSNSSSGGGGGGGGGGNRRNNQIIINATSTLPLDIQARIAELQRLIISLIQRLIVILVLRLQSL